MKNLLLAGLVALSTALSAPAFAAQPSTMPPAGAIVRLSSHEYISLGMSPAEVEAAFGAPGAKLASTAWVYWDFKAAHRPAGETYDTLVLGFIGDRLSYLRLVPSQPARAFIAQQQKINSARVVRAPGATAN